MVDAPMRARRRQQPDETRTLIVETADRLLRDRPFRELSVDELMRLTGYGRTVFYRHFSGLPDLVGEVLARVLPALEQAGEAVVATAGEDVTPERARAVIGPLVAHWRRHGALMKALGDAAVYDPEIEALVVATQDRLRARIAEALRRRQAIGYLSGADPTQVARALHAMTQRYLLESYGDRAATVDDALAVDTLALVWVAALNAR